MTVDSYVVGVDLGGTNVRAAVVNAKGEILGECRMDSRAMDGVDATVGQTAATVREAVESAKMSYDDVSGIGMGIPGTVRSKTGEVIWSPNFKDWNQVQVAQPIEDLTGKPVFIGNDANVAALGEYSFGAGVGSQIMVMITLGTGIGSGLIIDGRIYVGATECAPEVGHHIILADGPRCSCGRSGCLESLAGRDPICHRAARKAHQGRATSLLDKSGHDLRYITPAMIAEAASEGDEVSVETLDEVGCYIGIALANAINILNPDRIVIGGGVARAGDLIFDPIRRSVEVNALYEPLKACTIVPAMLGDDSGVLGGAAMAAQALG